ncbi:MAG: tyrosine-type recombinase/integrase [Leptospirales bacterium]
MQSRERSLFRRRRTEKIRIVPLPREAVRILSTLPRRIDGNVWRMTQDAITRAFLLILKRGREAYEKDCKEKGSKPDPKLLSDITFHDLRHEATSRFFEKGLNPMQVSAITGHKTLQM